MKYIETKKPIVNCICGCVMQPPDSAIFKKCEYDTISLSPNIYLGVYCPLCKNVIRVRKVEEYYTNYRMGE